MIDILLKGILIYFIVLIVIRFMGKREIGQLSIFDFAILLIIADILVSGLSEDTPFYYFVIVILSLSFIQKLLSLVLLKWVWLRNIIEGKQSIIMMEGKLNIKEMKKQNYNIDDLIVQMRIKNISSLSEVRFIILETNGEISIYPFQKEDVGTPAKTQAINVLKGAGGSDAISETNNNDIYPFPVIVSGKINFDNIKLLKIDEEWVINEASKQGKEIKDIYYANYEYGGLFIVETKDV